MALPLTYDQVVLDYPQIATTSLAKQMEFNTIALIAQNNYFCVDSWGVSQEVAITWYMLHINELANIAKKTANGTLSSIELEDDGRISFHKSATNSHASWKDRLHLTYYGGLLLDLYNSLFPSTPTRLVGIARGSIPVGGFFD